MPYVWNLENLFITHKQILQSFGTCNYLFTHSRLNLLGLAVSCCVRKIAECPLVDKPCNISTNNRLTNTLHAHNL